MEELLMELARTARGERAVAREQIGNGMSMLVYPQDDAVIVGIGYDPELAQRIRPQDVLRRRTIHIARLGAWLPVMFTDGSFFVVRRVEDTQCDADAPILSADELAAAEELLA